MAHVKELNSSNVKRKIFDNNSNMNIQLHRFYDASKNAYGACIYIRSNNKQGGVQVSLLCAKSRVAPIKIVPIPRLKLYEA